MRKKFIFLLVLLVLVSSLFVGCGEKTDQSAEEITSQATGEELGKETKKTDTGHESLDIDYENMTEEDLVEELIEDTNNVSIDEYLSLLETYKYSKSDNFEEDLSVSFGKTGKAFALLSKEEAKLPDPYETLEKGIESPEPIVRGKVLAYANGSLIKDEQIVARILEFSKIEKDPYVIKEIASTLKSRMENTEVADFMLETLNHEHPAVRCAAIEGLTSLEKIDGSVERLIEMMNDEDESVRKKAYVRIGNLGDDKAIDPLMEILMDPEKTDYHVDCMSSLLELWLGHPFYEQISEKAYNATIEYLKYTPRSEKMPYFKAINEINRVSPGSESDIKDFEEWKEKATYYNPNDLVEPMFDIVKDPEIHYLACEYAIDLVNKYGSKEQFDNLKLALESSTHPKKEDILETYKKIAEERE